VAAAVGDDESARLAVSERRLVGAGAGDRVVGVDQGDDAGRQRDVGAGEPGRVAAAIPALVMRADDVGDLLEPRDARASRRPRPDGAASAGPTP
jgi:hypothetical protein